MVTVEEDGRLEELSADVFDLEPDKSVAGWALVKQATKKGMGPDGGLVDIHRRNKRVTVRMSPLEYYSLVLLAEEVGETRTGCAEGILNAGIAEALRALRVRLPTGDRLMFEVLEFLRQEAAGVED